MTISELPFGTYYNLSPLTVAGYPFYAPVAQDLNPIRFTQDAFVLGVNDPSNYWTIEMTRLSDGVVLWSFRTSAQSVSSWQQYSVTPLPQTIDKDATGLYEYAFPTGKPGGLRLSGPLLEVYISEVDIFPQVGDPDSPFALRGRSWNGQHMGMAVPYFIPIGTQPNIHMALDLLVKGNPPDLPGCGATWIHVTDTNEQRLANNDFEAVTVGKFSNGIGHVSMEAGTGAGNSIRNLILQAFGGNVGVGTLIDGMTPNGSLAIAQDLAHRGTLAGFYNNAPALQPSPSKFNNYATLADLVSALQSIGIIG